MTGAILVESDFTFISLSSVAMYLCSKTDPSLVIKCALRVIQFQSLKLVYFLKINKNIMIFFYVLHRNFRG